MVDHLHNVIIVTGLSGAGKSTAVHALEDLGYYCVDNLPPPVLEPALKALQGQGIDRVAFGVDVRMRGFLEEAVRLIDRLVTASPETVRVLFLDAEDQALLKRFNSTRRPHPLGRSSELEQHAAIAVIDGIHLERERLARLRMRAALIVDSTDLTVHELRRKVVATFSPAGDTNSTMLTRIMSFGFKHGAPIDADVVLDVRFLDNPYFVEHLRAQSGLDSAVREYVLSNPDASEFLARATELLEFCLPRFEAEGKAYLTVGVGCTGGRHRSVVLAVRLAAELAGRLGREPVVVHRDLGRASTIPGSSEVQR